LVTQLFVFIIFLGGTHLNYQDMDEVVFPSGDETIGDSVAECWYWVDELTEAPDWHYRLIDPVLSSEIEIAEMVEKYSRIHTCLNEVIERDTPELERIHILTEYFLIFAGGYQTAEEGSELHLVELAKTDDPAVVKIRDEAGLPPPSGYVFMRLYDSRESMPPRLQAIFADRLVAGVTIFSRYIAVPTETGGSIQDQILHQRTLPRTVSHELIHAYVHASLHPRELGTLPEWFNEGVAIYFSESGENHILVTPNAVMARTSTAEYLEYKEIFDYLEARLGQDRFYELIRTAIEQVEPSLVYRELSIEDEVHLRALVQEWRNQRIRQGQILSLASVILLAVFVVWLVPPEVRCTCGYAGNQKKFVGDRCPRCEQVLEQKKGSVRRRFRKILKGCEVCGRKFWLGNIDQVDELHRESMVWVDQWGGAALEKPDRERVSRICQVCRLQSVELENQHREQMRLELESARKEAASLYKGWLSRAPYDSQWFQDGLEMFSFGKAVEHFVDAAVYPRYKMWIDEKPGFHFREFYGKKAEDFFTDPPSGYENVLVRRVRIGVSLMRLYGTVRRFEGERVGIHWMANREYDN
jgi:hypothetical protein